MDYKRKGRFPMWSQFKYSLKHRGAWNTLAMGLTELRKDWELGIDTLGNRTADELTIECGSKDVGHFYQPSSSILFEKAMNQLPFNFNDKVFLDLGSGKGRALVLAAEAGFKKVIGVEYATELNDIAYTNIEKVRSRYPSTEFILTEGDALNYEIGQDVDVIYLFNPFDEEAIDILARRLKPILERKHEVHLVYVHPVHCSIFEKVLGHAKNQIRNSKGMVEVAVFGNQV